MSYVLPENVSSPKDRWTLIRVLLNHGERRGAYALGLFDGEPRIGFRWNGGEKKGRRPSHLGNPQSRGLATWTMLEPELHEAVLDLPGISPSMRAFAKQFLRLDA